MEKTGWEKIENKPVNGRKRPCQSCRRAATKKVTFADIYGKLIVSLCDKCAEKDYFELLIQGRFSWPVKGETEV